MNTTRDYTIGSVKKALEILKLFDEQHQELSLSELSELAGIGKSRWTRGCRTGHGSGYEAR